MWEPISSLELPAVKGLESQQSGGGSVTARVPPEWSDRDIILL